MHPSLLLGGATHRELLELLKARGTLTVSGVANETAKALLLAQCFELEPRKMVMVLEDEKRRLAMRRWLHFFDVATTNLGRELPKGETVSSQSLDLRALLSFFTSEYAEILLVTKEEWNMPLPSLAALEERKLSLTVGENVDITGFFEGLLERGYTHGRDLHLSPGEYRKIGDTLDIFPLQSETPFKILFHLETVEAIRHIDEEDSSQTVDAGESLDIYPGNWTKEALLAEELSGEHLLIFDEQEEAPPANVPTILFTAFPQTEEGHVHLRYLSVLKFYTLTDFLNDIRDKITQQWMLLVVTKRATELMTILAEENIPHAEAGERRPGAVSIEDASGEEVLPHSVQNPDLKIAMLTDREVFTLRRETKQRSVQKLALDFITSLQPGDFVVHMDHGIGRFTEVVQKTVAEVTREYLELRYAGNDRLFIPIDQADKLSKFVHEEGGEPALSRLGSNEWKRTIQKVKEDTKKIAAELLKLYAKRARAKGHAYPLDTPEQKRFEESFPYTETPGQIKAIQDIKQDMEDEHPMDRLICGDVGFGKTEVAMRAAFKAVQAGKQVALIAPITILADQHYHTLQQRLLDAGFPDVRMDMLSRFRSKAEQTVVLEKLRKGDMDIVVGTHRLLQDDVRFFNLGLLIIDEEQRFGVKQKERLKELRANVDVLTLTATPIPRTLNLSLQKFRDITTITTPPPGRLPIITEVRKYSDGLLRQAILTEKKRDGQIYVLHNRVETIDAFAAKLQRLVPEATFIVSHGQLPPDTLEERVLAFKEGKYDVLVSSTIIENGIDLPRANTLIVNEAERFGLAQLYQLRGRVGRGKVQAYAYFLYHTQRLSEDAKKRLRAIVEASELGSGFQIAMRDLEIRGAGEILGGEQSGHMNTVGMSHFLRLLKQTVDEMQRGAKSEEAVEENTEINLAVEAFIPGYYIPDDQEKIGVYQKLASAEEEGILAEFEHDLLEEYGAMPVQVENLFKVLRFKMICRKKGVIRVKEEIVSSRGSKDNSGDIVLTLAPRMKAEHIIPLLGRNPLWKVVGQTLRISMKNLGEDWFARLKMDVETIGTGKITKNIAEK